MKKISLSNINTITTTKRGSGDVTKHSTHRGFEGVTKRKTWELSEPGRADGFGI